MILCIEIVLIIPDNEARTALTTLQRLGIAAGGLERADLYRFDVAEDRSADLIATIRGFEAVYNPNKHALRVRDVERPVAGEVWVDEIGNETQATDGAVRIAGRVLPGVRALERFKAWRVTAPDGSAADAGTLTGATETLLRNPAFQKAIRA